MMKTEYAKKGGCLQRDNHLRNTVIHLFIDFMICLHQKTISDYRNTKQSSSP